MSAIIQKLSELSKLNITLPISEQALQINKINLVFVFGFSIESHRRSLPLDFRTDFNNPDRLSTQNLPLDRRNSQKLTYSDLSNFCMQNCATSAFLTFERTDR